MNIAYVTTYDASDPQNWSGLGYYIARSISSASSPVEFIGPLRQPHELLFKAKKLSYRHVFGKEYHRERQPTVLRSYARQVRKHLETSAAEVVFSPGSLPLAYLRTDRPLAFWTDACFAGMLDFYPQFTNLAHETIRDGNMAEQRALDTADLVIYASQWAAETALTHYSVDPQKIKVVPFGANIDVDFSEDDARRLIETRPRDKCRLLFLGVEWQRKGGDLALAVAGELNRAGLATELTIVGCDPVIDGPLPQFARSLGLVAKSTDCGASTLYRLFSKSHFLIVPSRAECYGVVYCEANAFAVPCIARSVGGVQTIIRDGVNGCAFDEQASVDAYTNYVLDLFENYDAYVELAQSAYREYRARLNWSVAGGAVLDALAGLVRK